jgi:hypothetical protein
MDSELQRSRGLSAFAGKNARMALETPEDFGEPQAARLEIAERRGRLALRSGPRRELSLSRPIDRGDRRYRSKRGKRRQHGRERIGWHARIGFVSRF